MSKSLDKLFAENKALVDAMTPEEKAQMIKQQAESWARAESNWPKPKFRWVHGVKVYDSFEDYCND